MSPIYAPTPDPCASSPPRFRARSCHSTEAKIDEALAKFDEFELIAREGDRVLSLALAPTPRAAAERIRRQARELEPKPLAGVGPVRMKSA